MTRYPLPWLTAAPGSVTVALAEDADLIVKTGPFESQESIFPCRYEPPLKYQVRQLLRVLDELLDEDSEDD